MSLRDNNKLLKYFIVIFLLKHTSWAFETWII